jgi:hypothetical protein
MKTQTVNKTAKVFAWTFTSAFIAGLTHLAVSGQLPNEWLWLVPAVNTFLFGAKEWLSENKPE